LQAATGTNSVVVSTFNCGSSGLVIADTVPVINAQANANFELCGNGGGGGSGNCEVYINTEQLDSLTYEFSAFFVGQVGPIQGISYLWNFGDGNTSTEVSPIHTYAGSGTYTISLTVTGVTNCNTASTTLVVTSVPPDPNCFVYLTFEQTGMLTYQFEAVTNAANNTVNYNWDFGDGNTSTAPSPSHTYDEAGAYLVVLTITTPDGCVAYACDFIFTFDCPVDTFWYGCQAMYGINYTWDSTLTNFNPLTIQFQDLSLGSIIAWNWNFGDGTISTEPNPTHTYAQTGLYTVTLAIETVDGCESEISFELCVGNNCPWEPALDCQALFIPLPDIIGGNGFQFLDLSYASDPIQAWNWDFGNGDTSTEQNPFYVYPQAGNYDVTLSITTDSCQSEITFVLNTNTPWNFAQVTAQQGVAALTSNTTHVDAVQQLSVFPNPVQETLMMTFELKASDDIQVVVQDLTGRAILSQQATGQSGINAISFNTAALQPGIYFANLRTEKSAKSVKFVKL
jgi:PKD repeat protein